jgi:glyoxylase-like metal-dependent hydrolase (beta-lactamase superfamily II)
VKIGAYFVTPLCEGSLYLDGGAMFGLLPRPEWSKLMAPDADNRVKLALTHFLVQGHGKNVLIDAGIGEKLSTAESQQVGITRAVSTDALLAHHDLKREDIDLVITTHLHYSSAGGLTRMSAEGGLVPSYPNARVVIQEGEWERAIHANVRTRPLYRKEDFEPLLWHQCIELVDSDEQLMPGLHVRITGGHTKYHQIVVLDSESEGAVFWGDLIPTIHHVPLNTISAYDLYPLQSMEKKAEWLTRSVEQHWVAFLSRDPKVAAAQLSGAVRGEGGVELDALLTHE